MRAWRRLVVGLGLVAACGRVGFDPTGGTGGADDSGAGSGGPGDGAVGDGAPDGPVPAIACADVNLGSVTGPNVASGAVNTAGNQYTGCNGDGNDVTFGWFAPETRTYNIDLCASEATWDSALSVHNATCNGPLLGCSDDACGGGAGIQGRVTVNLMAGQGVVIIVDSVFPQDGNYQLAITPM